jgi:threonine aldolase
VDTIDLRSDTVTWPTSEMRQAMANAEVGDDFFREDPTVNRLEAMAAAYLGKEAALLVSSGIQANLLAVMTHCQRGDEIVLGQSNHISTNEVGGVSALGGVHPRTIPVHQDGTLDLDDLRAAIRPPDRLGYPRTRLITLENTHNRSGGTPLTVEYTQSVRELANEHDLRLHVDGARIWNAAAALDCSVSELAAPADSVCFCLSKGLCAPVGSMLCGSREFIRRARHLRQMVGGGMRQVGILAAAGIVALEKMTKRLHEDHATARQLAEGLASIPGVNIDMTQVQTNIVLLWLADWVPVDASTIAAELDMRFNVRLNVLTPRSFRAVTHYWITPDRVDQAVSAIRTVMENFAP